MWMRMALGRVPIGARACVALSGGLGASVLFSQQSNAQESEKLTKLRTQEFDLAEHHHGKSGPSLTCPP